MIATWNWKQNRDCRFRNHKHETKKPIFEYPKPEIDENKNDNISLILEWIFDRNLTYQIGFKTRVSLRSKPCSSEVIYDPDLEMQVGV